MGTRGFITFVVDGVEKTAYQQFDSYPAGLGLTVLEWLRDEVHLNNPTNRTRLWRAAHDLRVVEGAERLTKATPVTPADVERLAEWTDLNVDQGRRVVESGEKLPTWYQLLRGTQGLPGEILRAGVVENAAKFPRDSLFAEWGYVIDLDDNDLEVYQGFQEEPHSVGRFAARGPVNDEPAFQHRSSVYYPCKRVAAWPLDELPTNDEFIAAAQRFVKE